ncbi:TPA: AAA family ATPase [Legionella pneumophila]|nr:AAA family ATPase [Legionella pneumophila]
MIESLSISKVATYGDQPEILTGLSKFNFIFGSNGTGKTTISRIIAETEGHKNCSVNWAGGMRLKALVYNCDFVDAYFKQATEIKGVFTLGKENIETLTKISNEKSALEGLEKQIRDLQTILDGKDGVNGKNGELKTLEENLKNKCWAQKQKHDYKLKGAFEGYRNSADRFKSKVIQELESNTAKLVPLTDLEKRAETIFGEIPSRERIVSRINITSLMEYETHPILSKRVLGKADVDIAGMIKKLGNSDWVRQGRQFYKENADICPFCQQETSDAFAKSLAEYFDETFELDSKTISDLEMNYKSVVSGLQQKIADIISTPSRFLNIEKLKLEKQLLDSKIDGNLQKLTSKIKEPSQHVELDSTDDVIKTIDKLIDEANTSTAQHNSTVDNITQERETLTEQVWKFILEELKIDLANYMNTKSELNSTIASLNEQISTKKTEKNQKVQEIRNLEKQTTSIQPTIDGINKLLRSFGFHGFSLAPAENEQYYKLIRADGRDATITLSEGERTFVTFLYFYHLLKGSDSEIGITDNRVVVFDDPVSSLDSEILFIVSSLIRELFEEVKHGNGHIKQIFVLTHNVYFHKEVSYNMTKQTSFWIVRKSPEFSTIKPYKDNPIKTSYELLWTEVKNRSKTNQIILQNVLRRILEQYFKIWAGINLGDIHEKFEGQSKLICKSLVSWIHDGSHSIPDDIYVSSDDASIDIYLSVFKEIFEKTKHIAHYKMMMGENFEEED